MAISEEDGGLLSRQELMRAMSRLSADGPEAGATVLAVQFDMHALVVTFGYDRAEQLIEAAGDRVRRVGDGAAVGWLSADTVVLACGRLGEARARERAAAVQSALRAPLEADGHEIVIAPLIGIAEGDGENPAELVQGALAAARAARGRGGVEIFEPAMRANTLERLRLESELRRAIDDGSIELRFQPIVLAESQQVVAFEALARWRRRVDGRDELVPPSTFIALAEESDLIVPLGRRVLARACEVLARWNRLRGDRRLNVSVNLSAHELGWADLPAHVEAEIDRTGIDPDQLSFELTETALLRETPVTADSLIALRSLGVWLILDDFGTGFASLSMLGRVLPRVVKIDRMFVVASDRVSAAIVRATVEISAQLNAYVVAEGVETEEQLERALGRGCRYVQGFLIARPLSGEAADALALRGTVRGWKGPPGEGR